MRLIWAASIAVMMAGCLVTSDFDNIVGVRPPTEPAPGVDGGGEAPRDGGSTPSPRDGGGPAEPDATTDDATVSTRCAPGHLFCVDFDDIDRLPVPSFSSGMVSGTLAIDSARSTSAPKSLLATVNGATQVDAYVFREVFVDTVNGATLSFDFQLVQCPAQNDNSLTFAFIGTGNNTGYGMIMRSVGTLAYGSSINNAPTFFDPTMPMAAGAWTRVTYDLQVVSATVMHLKVAYNGTTALDTDAPGAGLNPTFRVEFGIRGAKAPRGCSVAFDHVTFDKR